MRLFDLVFFLRDVLGKFCTANPGKRVESESNYLELKEKYFGTQSATLGQD
jgi:hypothetical protein